MPLLKIMKRFQNRKVAGQLLAKKLVHFSQQKDAIVLALPRGGVPIGYEIAKNLNLPLDIFLVRKLGVPWQEELAMGAIAEGNVHVFNSEIILSLAITQNDIDKAIAQESQILVQRQQKYRGDRPSLVIKNKTVILVDDGIATGATMRAAIKALRKSGSTNVIVATPVAPPEAIAQFSHLVDQVICLETPTPFYAIGNWYEDFSQTSDEEVCDLLQRAAIREKNHDLK